MTTATAVTSRWISAQVVGKLLQDSLKARLSNFVLMKCRFTNVIVVIITPLCLSFLLLLCLHIFLCFLFCNLLLPFVLVKKTLCLSINFYLSRWQPNCQYIKL